MPKILPVQVPDFPGYFAETDGSVWSAWKTRRRAEGGRGVESYISNELTQLNPSTRKDGYKDVKLRKEGKYYSFLLHRLICLTFHGPCPDGMECLHWDGNHDNCQATNLRWGTRQENMEDMIRHGRTTKGERDSQAKLTDEQVLEIVELLRQRVVQTEIAERFNVSQGAIGHIAQGKTWGHITKGLLPEQYAHWSEKPNAAEGIAKMSASLTGQKHTEEHKAAIGASHWSNREDADEVREKVASKLRGQKRTPEQCENIRAAKLRTAERKREEKRLAKDALIEEALKGLANPTVKPWTFEELMEMRINDYVGPEEQQPCHESPLSAT
jgi:HNH endonuclease